MWFEFGELKGAKISLHMKSPAFRAAILNGFTVCFFIKHLSRFGWTFFAVSLNTARFDDDTGCIVTIEGLTVSPNCVNFAGGCCRMETMCLCRQIQQALQPVHHHHWLLAASTLMMR